jgi:hypothetical protein
MKWPRSVLRSKTSTQKRFCDRFASVDRMQISWDEGGGRTKRRGARVVNINSYGALVRCGAYIPPGSLVYIQSRRLGIMGGAHIRHCEPLLVKYAIGLQFTQPLGLPAC